ncbi:PREDICTED: sentrin-specific protease 5 isoform X2 [Pygoscelis adeliae]|uniref:sentrin-specific protease 5 isoform X2 n=1 Tax=Pygoscelis adeliae TaxID=9238 RepID=UPI0004F4F397|nr:PREDICTED: sentrin-specific protease 5 isoform X2 [Pygoscelis adeliae]
MKNHRRHLLWKRSQLLAQPRKWTTGFGELGKYCFQKQFFLAKKKRQSAQLIVSLNHNKLYRRLQCRRKALELQRRWAPDVPLNAETYQKPTVEPYSFPYKTTESKKILSLSQSRKPIWRSRFLDEVMKKYGSLVPLCEKDVMGRLKEVFNEDFSHRKPFITREIMKYREKHPKTSTCNFRVFYNKHMLDMDDLATLEGQNWLNDQIINMYGELIMDAVPEKVHFFNSFFHRQLVTKGYNGVKRWTKKVDLFKKTLLLIPIHLEVHWSLITVNIPNRIISFYDSQGIHFKFCVENIRKYLLTEAKEKNRPEFLQGWQTAVTKCIPQQKNDSDCGVFVLQYCKCLALDQPFQFSQEDMPRVRKRIYKELCERQLID